MFDNQRYTLIACCAAWCHLLDAIWLPIELCRGVVQWASIFVFEMVIKTNRRLMEKETVDVEREMIESFAFIEGKRSSVEELISSYKETSEERECFCF